MGDVDDDNVFDLIVGAGKDHAPEGRRRIRASPRTAASCSRRSSARFAAFAPEARGGISVTSSQIDGSTADNIIVGSGPGIPSEVKVFGSKLPSAPGDRAELFSTFKPYINDQSGVSVASGFVDFTTGRYSIITAPGPGTPAHVKIFSYSLMRPIGTPAKASGSKDKCDGDGPALTGAFLPFGLGYRGGLSLATGWLAGPLGGAEGIVVGQLESPGAVKVYSSGSRLQGGPKMYLSSFLGAQPRRRLYRDPQLQAVRRRNRRTRGHEQHGDRRRSARERRRQGQERSGSQIQSLSGPPRTRPCSRPSRSAKLHLEGDRSPSHWEATERPRSLRLIFRRCTR